MAQKSRNDLTSIIGSNIFDNNNKEILAAMVRAVLNDFRDSKFNLIDDELKGVTYQKIGDTNQTLEQYLNSIVGALPVYGTVLGVNVGLASGSLSVNGIISSASYINGGGGVDSLIEINFSQNVANRRLIPILTTTSSNWDSQNDSCFPSIRRISSTRINLAIRKVAQVTQDLNIEIIAI